MYKITRDVILDVNNPSTQGTITIPQGTVDAYRLAMHITAGGHPVDLSDCLVQLKANKPDNTEIYGDCDIVGDTAYYIVQPQFAAAVGYVDCQVEISEMGPTLYTPKFRCIITSGVGLKNITSSNDYKAFQSYMNNATTLINTAKGYADRAAGDADWAETFSEEAKGYAAAAESHKNASAESAANAANSEAAALQYLQEIQSGATDEKVKITAITSEDSEGTVFFIPFTDDSSTHTGQLKMCDSVLKLTGGNGAMAQLTIGNGQGNFKGHLIGSADYASQASCLIEGSKIGLSGAVTGTPTEFYGDEDITIPVTAVDPTKLSASVPITKGGTGASTAAAALVNLGLSATAAEINHCQGAASNIQSQLDAILDRIKIVNELPADAAEHPDVLYFVMGNGGDAS